jgi:TonB family protein
MAKIEKADQIDHYLDQIDKKQDSSFKKRIFLFIGLLLLSGVSFVAYSQLSGRDSIAEGSASINTNNMGSPGVVPITVNNNNLDDELLPEDEELLDPALNPDDANLAEAEAQERKEDAQNRNEEENRNENVARPTVTGVSDRTYTAAELAILPSAQKKKIETDKAANKNIAPSKNEDEAAKKAAASALLAETEAAKKAAADAADKATADKKIAADKAIADAEAAKKAIADAKKTTSVTKDPSYPGGEARMRQFFARRISYPNDAINERIEGNVDVRIKVDERGKIVDSQVVKGIGAGCDKEVLKAINRMPRWEPAEKDGEPVSKYYLLSVAFKLPN